DEAIAPVDTISIVRIVMRKTLPRPVRRSIWSAIIRARFLYRECVITIKAIRHFFSPTDVTALLDSKKNKTLLVSKSTLSGGSILFENKWISDVEAKHDV